MAQKYRVRYLTISAKVDARDVAALATVLQEAEVSCHTVSTLVSLVLSNMTDNLVSSGKVSRPDTIEEAEILLQALGYNINVERNPSKRVALLQGVELTTGGYFNADEVEQMEKIVALNKERLERENSALPVDKGIGHIPEDIPPELEERVKEKEAEEVDLLDGLGQIPTSENRIQQSDEEES